MNIFSAIAFIIKHLQDSAGVEPNRLFGDYKN
jgi:hypothetical protein